MRDIYIRAAGTVHAPSGGYAAETGSRLMFCPLSVRSESGGGRLLFFFRKGVLPDLQAWYNETNWNDSRDWSLISVNEPGHIFGQLLPEDTMKGRHNA